MNIINNLPINKILLISITLLLVGCNDTPSDNNTHTRLKKVLVTVTGASANGTTADTVNGYKIEDSANKLEWVDESKGHDGSNRTNYQCKFILDINGTNANTNVANEAKTFCDGLTYLTKTDWRVPTKSENKTYLLAMKAANRIPYYTNPNCGQVVSMDKNSTGAVGDFTLIYTHNKGADTGKEAITKTGNVGIRCVREMN